MNNVTALKQEPENSSQLELICETISNAPGEAVLEAVSALVEAQSASDFELGGYLSRVRAEEKLRPDNMSFNDWLETQGIKPARGNRLAQVYERIIACDLPHDILDRVEWSKLCLIASRLQEGNSKEATSNNIIWIGLAEMASQKALQEAMSADTGKIDKPKLVQHVLKLPADQEKAYQSAVKDAKKSAKVETEVEAVNAIVTNYLSAKSKPVTLQSMMKESGPEKVMKVFVELWPDLDITAAY